ncbi:MAG: hypothetical protein GXO83_08195 [Chlorobi bacterium]|nr:hypothetical protein [Chlorobiota bacterium]
MKTPVNKLVAILLIMLAGLPLRAQNQDRIQRLNAQKIAFFTERLNLTPEEAQQFWPVYNAYQQEKSSINKAKREILQDINRNSRNMDDKELEELADRFVDYDRQLADIQIKYHQEFKKVLPIRKVVRLYQAEQQFTTFLLRQIQNRRENMQPQRRR